MSNTHNPNYNSHSLSRHKHLSLLTTLFWTVGVIRALSVKARKSCVFLYYSKTVACGSVVINS